MTQKGCSTTQSLDCDCDKRRRTTAVSRLLDWHASILDSADDECGGSLRTNRQKVLSFEINCLR